MSVTQAVKVNEYQSDAAYKKKHNAEKGQLNAFIPADTPEFERLKKMQEQYSDLEYREQARKALKEITFSPSLKEAARAHELASQVKYSRDAKAAAGKNLQGMDAVTKHGLKVTDSPPFSIS